MRRRLRIAVVWMAWGAIACGDATLTQALMREPLRAPIPAAFHLWMLGQRSLMGESALWGTLESQASTPVLSSLRMQGMLKRAAHCALVSKS